MVFRKRQKVYQDNDLTMRIPLSDGPMIVSALLPKVTLRLSLGLLTLFSSAKTSSKSIQFEFQQASANIIRIFKLEPDFDMTTHR